MTLQIFEFVIDFVELFFVLSVVEFALFLIAGLLLLNHEISGLKLVLQVGDPYFEFLPVCESVQQGLEGC